MFTSRLRDRRRCDACGKMTSGSEVRLGPATRPDLVLGSVIATRLVVASRGHAGCDGMAGLIPTI